MGDKSAPQHSTAHRRSYGARYEVRTLPDGHMGMELDRGVLDGEDGCFYPLPAESPDTRPTVKLLMLNGHLAYCPAAQTEDSGVIMEYR